MGFPRENREIRIRTCIATRAKHNDDHLLRLVLDPEDDSRSVVIADPQRNLPGRGAWMVPTLEALKLAEDKRVFGRALRTSAKVDTTKVREYLKILLRGEHQTPRTDEIVRKT